MRSLFYGLAFLCFVGIGAQSVAFTDIPVNARTPTTLQQSLEQMIAEMSLKEQMEFMTAFFQTAYASAPAKVPYAQAQSRLLVPRMGVDKYARASATAFVSDRRMDSLDPASAYTVWKSEGWSKNESYVRFILAFGDAVDGLSGHQLVSGASLAQAKQADAQRQQQRENLEAQRQDFIRDLQLAEARYGACKSFDQEALRSNIRGVEQALVKLANGDEVKFRPTLRFGMSSKSCDGKPAVQAYAGAPADEEVAAAQQQAQAQNMDQDARFQSAVSRMVVKRTHELKFAPPFRHASSTGAAARRFHAPHFRQNSAASDFPRDCFPGE